MNKDFGQRAFIDSLDLHGGLIGLDFGNHITGLNRITLFNKPFCELTLFHGWRERRHKNFGRHNMCLSLPSGGK